MGQGHRSGEGASSPSLPGDPVSGGPPVGSWGGRGTCFLLNREAVLAILSISHSNRHPIHPRNSTSIKIPHGNVSMFVRRMLATNIPGKVLCKLFVKMKNTNEKSLMPPTTFLFSGCIKHGDSCLLCLFGPMPVENCCQHLICIVFRFTLDYINIKMDLRSPRWPAGRFVI